MLCKKNEEGVDEVNGRTGERDAHFPGFHLRQNLNEKEKKEKRENVVGGGSEKKSTHRF